MEDSVFSAIRQKTTIRILEFNLKYLYIKFNYRIQSVDTEPKRWILIMRDLIPKIVIKS